MNKGRHLASRQKKLIAPRA